MERESYKLDPALTKPRYFGNPKAKVHKIPIFNLAMSACVFARLQYSLWFSKQSRQVCFLTEISIFEGYWKENNICVICPYFSIKSSSILDFELCDHSFLYKFVVIIIFWGRWSQVIISNQICIARNFLPFGRHGCVERKLTRKTFHAML